MNDFSTRYEIAYQISEMDSRMSQMSVSNFEYVKLFARWLARRRLEFSITDHGALTSPKGNGHPGFNIIAVGMRTSEGAYKLDSDFSIEL